MRLVPSASVGLQIQDMGQVILPKEHAINWLNNALDAALYQFIRVLLELEGHSLLQDFSDLLDRYRGGSHL